MLSKDVLKRLLEQLWHLEPLHLVAFISTKYARGRSKYKTRARAVNVPGTAGSGTWKCFLSEAQGVAAEM